MPLMTLECLNSSRIKPNALTQSCMPRALCPRGRLGAEPLGMTTCPLLELHNLDLPPAPLGPTQRWRIPCSEKGRRVPAAALETSVLQFPPPEPIF